MPLVRVMCGGLLTVSLLAVTLAGHSRITTRLSWHAEILPLIERHCLGCHTDSGDAPMSLATYRDARPWARAIREEVLERRMPPWSARPGVGRFANERRLSPLEIDLLVAWIDGGAPEGKPRHSHRPRDGATSGHASRAASNGGMVLAPGVTRARTAMAWRGIRPDCPDANGSFSLSLESSRVPPRLLLDVPDVARPYARDAYHFAERLPITTGSRISVYGTAKCSAVVLPEHRSVAAVSATERTSPIVGQLTASDDRLPQTALGYWCPMHPEVLVEQPGTCHRCGMGLVDFTADLTRRYDWTIATWPASLRPGDLARCRSSCASATRWKRFRRSSGSTSATCICSL